MTKSDLSQLMEEQSGYPCVVLHPEDMLAEAPSADCQTAGRYTVVPPYETDADGRVIAEKFGHLPLLTGGSGLLEHLARLRCTGRPAEYGRRRGCTGLPRLLLAGSCSAVTQKQVQTYIEHGEAALRIQPDLLLSGRQTEDELRQAVAEAKGDLLLYSTASPEQVKKYQAAGASTVSALLEGLMGRLAVYGRDCGFRRIVAAGGETSGAVTRALGTHVYRIGKDVAPGVPEMWPVERENLGLVLKSGNFGDEDFFLRVFKDTGD